MDVVLIVGLLIFQIVAYRNVQKRNSDFVAYADALRSASTGGLTVVGILLPLSILAIQLRAGGNSAPLPVNALADFYLASLWLFASLLSGLYVLYVAAIRGPVEDVANRRDIGILFGAQLFFLFASGYRLVWAVSSVISALLV